MEKNLFLLNFKMKTHTQKNIENNFEKLKQVLQIQNLTIQLLPIL